MFSQGFSCPDLLFVDLAGAIQQQIQRDAADLLSFYKELHTHPELSLAETESARRIAERLEASGYSVTSGVGGTGVVGILTNGDGPTVLVRGDMDALPQLPQLPAIAALYRRHPPRLRRRLRSAYFSCADD